MASPIPQLLVSVRSPAEARSAISGGCDLLDIKEPTRGSLGAADSETIARICQLVERSEMRPPISVALGELHDLSDEVSIMPLPRSIEFVKLGLSGCGASIEWPKTWRNLRRRVDEAAGRELAWIAVLYADPPADGPLAEHLMDLAATTGCVGVLVDTFTKVGGRLFDHVSRDQLLAWRTAARDAHLTFAVAGRLRRQDIPCLVDVHPDVVAVRSAVCRGEQRTATIDEAAVRSLRASLEATFNAHQGL